jgi:hypothetical protein
MGLTFNMGTQQYIKDMLVVKAAEKTVGRNLSLEEMSPEIGVELPTGRVVFIPQLAFPMDLIPTHSSSINEEHLDWFSAEIHSASASEIEQLEEKLFLGKITAMPKQKYVAKDADDLQEAAYMLPETCLDGQSVDPDHVEDEDEKYDRQTRGSYGQEDL